MYFLIACKDDPPRSFNPLIAFVTISDVGGWLGFERGFFVFFSFFDGELAGGVDATGAASLSAMIIKKTSYNADENLRKRIHTMTQTHTHTTNERLLRNEREKIFGSTFVQGSGGVLNGSPRPADTVRRRLCRLYVTQVDFSPIILIQESPFHPRLLFKNIPKTISYKIDELRTFSECGIDAKYRFKSDPSR